MRVRDNISSIRSLRDIITPPCFGYVLFFYLQHALSVRCAQRTRYAVTAQEVGGSDFSVRCPEQPEDAMKMDYRCLQAMRR